MNASAEAVIGHFMRTTKRLIIIFLLIKSFNLKSQIIGTSGYSLSDKDGSLYWGTTIIFSAINGTTTYFNIKKLHKYDKYRSNAIFGAITGGIQTALGFANIQATYRNAYIPTSVNIGIGLTTLVSSVVRLATKNPPKENNVAVNFLYLPCYDNNNSVVGLTLTKHFK